MILYDQTKMTELKHTTTVQRSITSENKHMVRRTVCWSPLKQTIQNLSKTYTVFRLKQVKNVHGHWFISLREQGHALLGSALHFMQITWFTCIFANIGTVSKWVQFAGCSLNLVTWASEGFFQRFSR